MSKSTVSATAGKPWGATPGLPRLAWRCESFGRSVGPLWAFGRAGLAAGESAAAGIHRLAARATGDLHWTVSSIGAGFHRRRRTGLCCLRSCVIRTEAGRLTACSSAGMVPASGRGCTNRQFPHAQQLPAMFCPDAQRHNRGERLAVSLDEGSVPPTPDAAERHGLLGRERVLASAHFVRGAGSSAPAPARHSTGAGTRSGVAKGSRNPARG